MSKVGRWSTAAGSNNSSPPNGWPEGQLPSTVNDCAREMMASIRTMIIDAQFIDQDFTPTFLTATSFSVPGNQTSAIQIGRRLKMFDATAGVQQLIYATVVSVSFTAVTTVHIESDSGSLTSSLSSFGISIISNVNNGLPRQSDMTISSLAVSGAMSISGASALNGPVAMGETLSVSGAAVVNGAIRGGSTLSISATAVASMHKGQNTAKAFASFFESAGGVRIVGSFNVSSISKSGTGVVRITFTNGFNDSGTIAQVSLGGIAFLNLLSHVSATVIKMYTVDSLSSAIDVSAHVLFYHA